MVLLMKVDKCLQRACPNALRVKTKELLRYWPSLKRCRTPSYAGLRPPPRSRLCLHLEWREPARETVSKWCTQEVHCEKLDTIIVRNTKTELRASHLMSRAGNHLLDRDDTAGRSIGALQPQAGQHPPTRRKIDCFHRNSTFMFVPLYLADWENLKKLIKFYWIFQLSCYVCLLYRNPRF